MQTQSSKLIRSIIGIVVSLVAARPVQAFTPTGAMSHPRAAHTATLLPNGKVLVAGGDGTNALSSAELYNPATGIWSETGPLGSARYDHTATLLGNGLVLVAGGTTNGGVCQTGAELYDPASGSWTPTGGLITSRAGHSATLLADGKVLVAGGYGPADLASAELYDPVAGNWTPVGEMAAPRIDHRAILLPTGQVLVMSGNSAELYDPVTRLWTNAGFMNAIRMRPSATLLPNGRVLVAGGLRVNPFGYAANGTADLYDPTAGTWMETGSMVFSNSALGGLVGRWNHTATLLPNGLVLVAGGGGSPYGAIPQSSTELYNPDNETWSPAGEMTTKRVQHTATLLPNGQVLLAGGYDFQASVANAELYWSGIIGDTRPILTDARTISNGSLQFAFTNTPGAAFSVLASTNPASPLSDWTMLGGLAEISPGYFEFTDSQATNYPVRFYQVRSP